MNQSYHHADVVIIGSGFGGSVAARRLVEAGYSVIVLERGPWRDTLPVREAGIANRKALPRTGSPLSMLRSVRLPFGPKAGIRLNKYGYMELWQGQGIKVPVTSNVGGGSHIWAAVLDRPQKAFWNHRAQGLSDDILLLHYQRVSAELGGNHPDDATTIPNHTDHAWHGSPYFAALEKGEQPMMAMLYPCEGQQGTAFTNVDGVKRQPFQAGESHGRFGSPSGAKATVDALYLLPALKKGLKVHDLHEVREIRADETGGYWLTARDLRHDKTVHFKAPRVVVASGIMNTNALLLKSREQGGLQHMPSLGKGFGANGDVIAQWSSQGKDASLGTPVQGRVKIAGYDHAPYMLLVSGEAPPLPKFLAKKAQKKARDFFGIVAMSQDAADGAFKIEKGRLSFAFDHRHSPSFKNTMQALDHLSALSGQEVHYAKDSVVTAHPMGGCRIADDEGQGVVNGYGEVHGHQGLYIADAAVFPQPIGAPPSLSIAAWASHVAQHMIANPVRI